MLTCGVIWHHIVLPLAEPRQSNEWIPVCLSSVCAQHIRMLGWEAYCAFNCNAISFHPFFCQFGGQPSRRKQLCFILLLQPLKSPCRRLPLLLALPLSWNAAVLNCQKWSWVNPSDLSFTAQNRTSFLFQLWVHIQCIFGSRKICCSLTLNSENLIVLVLHQCI